MPNEDGYPPTPWNPGSSTEPTPEQWVAHWETLPYSRRVELAQRILAAGHAEKRCVEDAHDSQIAFFKQHAADEVLITGRPYPGGCGPPEVVHMTARGADGIDRHANGEPCRYRAGG